MGHSSSLQIRRIRSLLFFVLRKRDPGGIFNRFSLRAWFCAV
jgi:hypothetical protein